MSNTGRRHSMMSSTTSKNTAGKKNNTSMLSSPLLTEVRSPGFSSRLSALIHADNGAGTLDSSRPRPYYNASGNIGNNRILTPPPGTAEFNRSTSCDR